MWNGIAIAACATFVTVAAMTGLDAVSRTLKSTEELRSQQIVQHHPEKGAQKRASSAPLPLSP